MRKSILVQFLRHSGFWLTTSDDVNIVIDPVLSSSYRGQELIPPPFEPTAIEKADAILITHLHPDHFDAQTIYGITRRTGAKVIAPLDVIGKLTLPNKKTRSVEPGETVSVKSVKIHVIGVGTYEWWDEEEKENIGYKLVTGDGIELLHPSDSLPLPKDAMGTDILFTHIAVKSPNKRKIFDLIRKTQPQFVIPMHYGTYTSIRADPEEIRDEVETEKTKMLVFYPGQVRKIQFNP